MLLSIASVSLRLSESCRDGNVTPLVASAYIRVRPRRDERRHTVASRVWSVELSSHVLWACTRVWIHCVVRRDPRDELQNYRRCGMVTPPQISGFARIACKTVHRRMCEDPSMLISNLARVWSVVKEMDATGRAAINQTCDATEKTCNGLLRKATRCTSSDASRRARPPRAPSSPCSAHQRATRAEPAAAPRRRVVWAAGAPAGVCAGGFGIHKRLWHDAPAAVGPLLAPSGRAPPRVSDLSILHLFNRHGRRHARRARPPRARACVRMSSKVRECRQGRLS